MTETQETTSASHHENLFLRLTVTLMDEWNLNNTKLASTWSMAMAIQKKALWNFESWKRKTTNSVKTKTQSNRNKLKNLMQCCWHLFLPCGEWPEVWKDTWKPLPSTQDHCRYLGPKKWYNRLIKQEKWNLTWRRRAKCKYPNTVELEQKEGYSTSLPVVTWRSRSVAKTA